MKNYRRNNYIGKMKKGFKQKLSLLMIACLLFTGYRGLTISGRADSSHTEQNNEIEVSGTQVKVQLLGADLRRAATEAILKGEKVGKGNLASYSKDQELATEFEEYFAGAKEIYNIPLNSIAENLEESLNAEEAGLQIYVERDAKNLDRLVRKESKESLLLYSKESAVAGLLPKKEEATTVSLTEEEKASDSNLERNTELTGSELITFVYENKSTERMTFQLSVDGNKYPKVTVSSKTSLFKQFLSDAKKAQAEAKNAKATEAKAETIVAQTTEEAKAEVESTEAKQESTEAQNTEESKASEEAQKDSDVAIVSTAAEATEESLEATEAKAEEKVEASEEVKEEKTEAPVEEAKEVATEAETTKVEKATEAVKASAEDAGLLKEITEHSEEFLPELHTVRFTQYSLNELGRKSQNVEVEGFGNVQVFYEEAAFDSDVVLEAKRLFKPEEEAAEGDKLSEEEVKILKEEALYEDSASLDIRFVDRKDNTTEVEPKSPVSVRITIEKKALPEEAKAEDISIHHIVEEEGTGKASFVETVIRSDNEKKLEKLEAEDKLEAVDAELIDTVLGKTEETSDKISKEFTVNSFSTYIVSWKEPKNNIYGKIRFHFVDENFKELAPTIYRTEDWLARGGKEVVLYYKDKNNGRPSFQYNKVTNFNSRNRRGQTEVIAAHHLLQLFGGYKLKGLYGQPDGNAGHPYTAAGIEITELTNWKTTWKAVTGEAGTTKFDKDCNMNDYYFVYTMCMVNKCKADMNYIEPKLLHDKYITKRNDGTYDLTLTAQTKKGNNDQKTKLDVLFVYDNTGNINEQDAEKTKNQVYELMDNLTANNSGFDARFALVSMNSESNPSYNANDLKAYTDAERNSTFNKNDQAINDISPIVGKLGNLGDNQLSPYNISDTEYNDLRTHEFSDKETIKNEFRKLRKPQGRGTGANYAAAINDARGLMDWYSKSGDPEIYKDSNGDYVNKWGNFQRGHTRNENLWYTHENNLVRKDAKAVVVFIAGGNPSKVYAPENGVYETFINHNGSYYLTRAQYKKGYSIGSGDKLYYPALNAAKTQLKYFVSLDAFYTVGVGNKSNWNKLEEFARVIPNGTDYKNFDASNISQLGQSFKALTNEIAEAKIHSINIEDTLSENVELVNGNTSIKGELVKMQANGVEEDYVLSEAEQRSLGLNKIEVQQHFDSSKNRTVLNLKTSPEDFVLPMGYELRLVANVKPTAKAYTNMAQKERNNNLDIGQPRTDLNDIYMKEIKRNKGAEDIYGTSVNKLGLYTNDAATITHKVRRPKGGDGTPPTESYNKPIIKVESRGYLRINKFFEGFDSKLFRESTGEWTNLGKIVLSKIYFDVYRKDADGEKLLTTINLGDGRWINDTDTFKNGKAYKIDGYDIYIHKIDTKSSKNTFQVTIDNLPMNMEYKIVERVVDQDAVLKEAVGDLVGYKYSGVKHGPKTQLYNLIKGEGQSYEFTNQYEKPKNPQREIIVKKEVKDLPGGIVSQAEKDRKFEFYLAFYDNNKKPYSYQEMIDLYNGLNADVKGKVRITNIPNPQNISQNMDVFSFKLSHNESLNFKLEHEHRYQVFEKKEDDYNQADITHQKGLLRTAYRCDVFETNGVYYSCTELLTEEKEITTFINPKKVPIPTGIVRDITPYLFGIFGFVAMAGVYLTIQKKRREA